MRASFTALDVYCGNEGGQQHVARESRESRVMAAHSSAQQESMTQQQRDRVLNWLHKNVPDARLKHVLRVEQMAIELAKHYSLPVDKAAQAGLMHDLAKFFKPQHLLHMAEAEGFAIDPVDQAQPHLLHAEVGAIVARDEFNIHDDEVLDAIRNHTLGRAAMSPLSCVVFLADTLEPGRGNTPELKHLRDVSWQDLHHAVWLACDHTLKHLLSNHYLVHPRAVETRNWAMSAATQSRQRFKEQSVDSSRNSSRITT
jgi:predicted HD superfamily hydrolase involved in NAD metabolism